MKTGPYYLAAAITLVPMLYQLPEVAGGPDTQDHELVAFVLEDLVAYRGKDSPLTGLSSPPAWSFDPRPSLYIPTIEDILHSAFPISWLRLSPAEASAPREAAEDLVARARGSAAHFTAGSDHVPLYTGGNPLDAPSRERPINASLPGYSSDRQFAIVVLGVPWSGNGCRGIYGLAKNGEAWRVRGRHFLYY
jgi:hypothetical protein